MHPVWTGVGPGRTCDGMRDPRIPRAKATGEVDCSQVFICNGFTARRGRLAVGLGCKEMQENARHCGAPHSLLNRPDYALTPSTKPHFSSGHVFRTTVDDITIQLARQGERDAQTRLLRAMQDHWFRFCCCQLRDPDRAQDAVQETALRVLKSISRFDGRSSFKTWSFGIALNVCREIRRRRIGVDLDSAPEPSTSEDQADFHMEFLDDSAALHRVLAELPDRQREVVTLRFFEEMSVADTAQAMQCAEGTVKATLFAAMRSLRTKLMGGAADA